MRKDEAITVLSDLAQRTDNEKDQQALLYALKALGRREKMTPVRKQFLMITFTELFALYPNKLSKGRAQERFIIMNPSDADLEHIRYSIKRHITLWKEQGRSKDKIPYFTTYLNGKDWLDFNPDDDVDGEYDDVDLIPFFPESGPAPITPEILEKIKGIKINE